MPMEIYAFSGKNGIYRSLFATDDVAARTSQRQNRPRQHSRNQTKALGPLVATK